MWIRDAIRRWRMKDPVRGDAVVVSCNNSDWFQYPQMLRAKLVVETEGVPKATVKHSQLIWWWTFHWPSASSRVPVVVDRAEPTRLRIDRRENDRRYKQRYKAAKAETERVETAKAYGTYDVEAEAAAHDPELQAMLEQEKTQRRSGSES